MKANKCREVAQDIKIEYSRKQIFDKVPKPTQTPQSGDCQSGKFP